MFIKHSPRPTGGCWPPKTSPSDAPIKSYMQPWDTERPPREVALLSKRLWRAQPFISSLFMDNKDINKDQQLAVFGLFGLMIILPICFVKKICSFPLYNLIIYCIFLHYPRFCLNSYISLSIKYFCRNIFIFV